MFKLELERAEEPEIKLPTSAESPKKQENSRKTSTSALLTTPKPLTVWIATICGKFLEMGLLDHLTCLLRNLYVQISGMRNLDIQIKKQQLEWDMEQQTSSKLGKEYVEAVYCHPVYLTYMQNTS